MFFFAIAPSFTLLEPRVHVHRVPVPYEQLYGRYAQDKMKTLQEFNVNYAHMNIYKIFDDHYVAASHIILDNDYMKRVTKGRTMVNAIDDNVYLVKKTLRKKQ